MSVTEEKFNVIFDTSPDSISIIGLNDERIIDVNQGFSNFLDYNIDDVKGEKISDINIFEDPASLHELINEIKTSGSLKNTEFRYRTKTSKIKHGLTSATLLEINGTNNILLITRDIEENKQIEKEINQKNKNLAILQEMGQELNTSLDTDTVSQMIIDNSVRLLELDSGAIYSINGSELKLEATTPPLPPDFSDIFRLAKLSDHPFIQRTIKHQEPIILEDTSTADTSPEEKKIMELRKLKSLIYAPLVDGNKTLGVMILGAQTNVRSFNESEKNLCKTFSTQATLNFKNAMLYDNLKKELKKRKKVEKELKEHRNKLEEIVKDRTKELENKNEELEKFNTLFIGREFRIKELKDKIEEMKSELNKYKTVKG